MTWGYHLIANLRNCRGCPAVFSGKKGLILAKPDIRRIVRNIVKTIDAKPYGPLVVEHFGDDPKIAGLSMYQLIETSNLSAHMVDKTKNVYFDIFSCKKYNPIDVKNILINELKPSSIQTDFMKRE